MDFDTAVQYSLNNPFNTTVFYRVEPKSGVITTWVRINNYGTGNPEMWMGWGQGETYEDALVKATEDICNGKKRMPFDIKHRPWARAETNTKYQFK